MKKKKKRRRIKPNVIIYTCLLSALVLLLAGAYDIYSETKDSSIKTTIKKAVNEVNNEKDVVIGEKEEEIEPDTIKELDKKTPIMSYLNNIRDRIITDKTITLDQINTWNSYSVENIKYSRQIADNYYEYVVDIKINNKNAKLPIDKREDLSTDEYVVITILVDMVYDNNAISVKNLDLRA